MSKFSLCERIYFFDNSDNSDNKKSLHYGYVYDIATDNRRFLRGKDLERNINGIILIMKKLIS